MPSPRSPIRQKQLARRQGIAGALVVLVLVGLGAAASVLHLNPVASRALKPARDLGNWVSETLHDRTANQTLEQEVRSLRRQAVAGEAAKAENRELRALRSLDRSGTIPDEARPVTGEVIVRSLANPYVSVTVDVGRRDGVEQGDPVVNGSGLVGKVTAAAAHSAQVKLITAQHLALAATVVGVGVHGLVVPSLSNPGHLSLTLIHPERLLQKGQEVVTSGWRSGGFASDFPSGLPIGVVAGGSIKEQQASARRSIRAYADLAELVLVQVLTGSVES